MGYIKHLIEEILANPNGSHEVATMIDEAIDDLKEVDEKSANLLMIKLHVKAYGYHFNEKLAKWAVSKMRNIDGSIGEHWSIEQTNQVLSSLGVNINQFDWYYAMNMLYSDLYTMLKTDASMYAKFAIQFYFSDIDSDDTKLFKQFIGQHYEIY